MKLLHQQHLFISDYIFIKETEKGWKTRENELLLFYKLILSFDLYTNLKKNRMVTLQFH